MARVGARGEVVLFGCAVLALAVVTTHVPGLWPLFGWTPALAALAVIVLTQRVGPPGWMSLGLTRSGLRAWPAAVLIPVAAFGAALAILTQLGWTTPGIPAGLSVPWWFALAAADVVMLSLFTLGEEVGWRGWLLPRLASYGRVRAGLAVGLLWGVWHVPAIGFDPRFLLAAVLIGYSVNEVAMASGSVWPAVILHGTHNALVGIAGGLAATSTGDVGSLMGTTGWVTIGVYGLIALAICALREPWSHREAARNPATIRSLPRIAGRA